MILICNIFVFFLLGIIYNFSLIVVIGYNVGDSKFFNIIIVYCFIVFEFLEIYIIELLIWGFICIVWKCNELVNFSYLEKYV